MVMVQSTHLDIRTFLLLPKGCVRVRVCVCVCVCVYVCVCAPLDFLWTAIVCSDMISDTLVFMSIAK